MTENPQDHSPADFEEQAFDYDHGGVPWYLVILYISYLVFILLYTLDWMIPAIGNPLQHFTP